MFGRHGRVGHRQGFREQQEESEWLGFKTMNKMDLMDAI